MVSLRNATTSQGGFNRSAERCCAVLWTRGMSGRRGQGAGRCRSGASRPVSISPSFGNNNLNSREGESVICRMENAMLGGYLGMRERQRWRRMKERERGVGLKEAKDDSVFSWLETFQQSSGKRREGDWGRAGGVWGTEGRLCSSQLVGLCNLVLSSRFWLARLFSGMWLHFLNHPLFSRSQSTFSLLKCPWDTKWSSCPHLSALVELNSLGLQCWWLWSGYTAALCSDWYSL